MNIPVAIRLAAPISAAEPPARSTLSQQEPKGADEPNFTTALQRELAGRAPREAREAHASRENRAILAREGNRTERPSDMQNPAPANTASATNAPAADVQKAEKSGDDAASDKQSDNAIAAEQLLTLVARMAEIAVPADPSAMNAAAGTAMAAAGIADDHDSADAILTSGTALPATAPTDAQLTGIALSDSAVTDSAAQKTTGNADTSSAREFSLAAAAASQAGDNKRVAGDAADPETGRPGGTNPGARGAEPLLTARAAAGNEHESAQVLSGSALRGVVRSDDLGVVGQNTSVQAAATLQSALPLAAAALPHDRLTPRVGSPAWDQALGQRVIWMAHGEQVSASLTLNPPDLGPMQIVLTVTNSHADASFMAAQPEVRQALEAAMPKLRDMLADAGIQLGQANVSTGTPQHEDRESSAGKSRMAGNAGSDADGPSVATIGHTVARAIGRGLVDTFA